MWKTMCASALFMTMAACADEASEPVVVEGHATALASWGVGNGRSDQASTASWGVGNGRSDQASTASWGVGNGRTTQDELIVLDPAGRDVPGSVRLYTHQSALAFEPDAELSRPGTYELAAAASGETLVTFSLAEPELEQANESGAITITIAD